MYLNQTKPEICFNIIPTAVNEHPFDLMVNLCPESCNWTSYSTIHL